MSKPKLNWQAYVRSMLAKGYGVEDIAVKLKVKSDSVREMVKIMRRNGVLDKLYGKRTAGSENA